MSSMSGYYTENKLVAGCNTKESASADEDDDVLQLFTLAFVKICIVQVSCLPSRYGWVGSTELTAGSHGVGLLLPPNSDHHTQTHRPIPRLGWCMAPGQSDPMLREDTSESWLCSQELSKITPH